MTTFFASHKLAVAGLLLAVAAVVILRRRQGGSEAATAAGVPVSPYSSTAPSQGSDPGTLAVPIAQPYGSNPDDGGPGPNTDAQTSTGPGAGPTVAYPYVNDPGLRSYLGSQFQYNPQPIAALSSFVSSTPTSGPGSASYVNQVAAWAGSQFQAAAPAPAPVSTAPLARHYAGD